MFVILYICPIPMMMGYEKRKKSIRIKKCLKRALVDEIAVGMVEGD